MIIPFREDKNLYRAYDEAITSSRDEYVCILDHDVCIVDPRWYQIIKKGIKEQAEIYTGWTNRVNCRWQVDHDAPEGDSIQHHRNFALNRTSYPIIDRTDEQLFSGFFFVISRSWWLQIERLSWDGMLLGLDNEIHKATREEGGRLLQLDLYFYHWYRGGTKDKSHLL